MDSPSRRPSVFRKVGLDQDTLQAAGSSGRDRPQGVRFRSRDDIRLIEPYDEEDLDASNTTARDSQTPEHRSSPWTWNTSSTMYRFAATILLVAAAVPFLKSASIFGHGSIIPLQAAEASPFSEEAGSRTGPDLARRSDSPTSWCVKWSGQSAVVNGTLYYYGGEMSTESGQTEDTWNNDFISLDLTTTWNIASPSLTGLAQPSGPPAVALGALWNSYDSLWMYGGEFSSDPAVSPSPVAVWEYSISSQEWIEHSDPTTSSGVNAPSNGTSVQRVAEGASASVPSLGRAFYFGGHEDGYTTPGWSQSIARIYLQSLLEFTYPGYGNDEVTALNDSVKAGTDGVYRNITESTLQASAGFTKRADGLLIFVPGFGDQGILLALAGGTNVTFTQMNIIDVYDIATSTWYQQSTSGSTPTIRVNPCAVIAAAADGSSSNIYMFGGQNLTPYGNQSEFDDMWILTLPAFTWIEVDQSNQSVPYGRSGAMCNVWDGQMVMVGGYVGTELSCDSPGIYVFDLGAAQWVEEFTALSSGSDDGSSDASSSTSSSTTSTTTAKGSTSTFDSTGSDNPFNQQPAQIASAGDPGGLWGSYGYTVPQIVIDVIGGDSSGGATVTAPIVTATAGPLATGHAVTYTVTGANGATTTETASAGGGSSTSSSGSDSGSSGPNIAAIVVGVICGILAIIVCYLAFCAYIYRKQLKLYKRHVEMQQAQARGEKVPAIPGLLASDSAKTSSDRQRGVPGSNNPYANAMGIGAAEASSQSGGSGAQQSGVSGGQTSSSAPQTGSGYQSVRRSSESSSTDDLMAGHEPTFVGVLLNPRRSLKVVNRD